MVVGPADLLGNTVGSTRFSVLFGPCLVLAMDMDRSRARGVAVAGGIVRVGVAVCVALAVDLAARFRRDDHDAVSVRFTMDSTPDMRTLRLDALQYVVSRSRSPDRDPFMVVPATLVAHRGTWWLYQLHAR